MILYDPDVDEAGVHVAEGGKEPGVARHGAVDAALRVEDDLDGRPHLRQLIPQDLADLLVRLDVEEVP
jgi:hypothetical protein